MAVGRHREKMAVCKARREALEETNSWHLELGLLASSTVRKYIYVFRSVGLCCCVMAAGTNQYKQDAFFLGENVSLSAFATCWENEEGVDSSSTGLSHSCRGCLIWVTGAPSLVCPHLGGPSSALRIPQGEGPSMVLPPHLRSHLSIPLGLLIYFFPINKLFHKEPE